MHRGIGVYLRKLIGKEGLDVIRARNYWWVLGVPLCVMCMIFYFSSQDAEKSSEVSHQVTAVIQEVIAEYVPSSVQVKPPRNGQVRAMAHIGLFFCMGLGWMVALYTISRRLAWSSRWTLILGAVIAVADECIQLGSAGRSFQLIDMGKDVLGVLLSITLVCTVVLCTKKINALWANRYKETRMQ